MSKSRRPPKTPLPPTGESPLARAASMPTAQASIDAPAVAGPSAPHSSWLAWPWRQARDFFAPVDTSTLLWTRWLVLRAVGVVYVFVFAGIIVESAAMIGPQGVAPLAPYLVEIRRIFPGFFGSFLAAPSLFWLNASPATIAALEWTGLLAAVAVVLNLWPRLALAVCWVAFLSFVETWADFSSAQLDRLMLETALLCIPFAPAGVRPRLGAASPPRRIAVFAVRWLLFRVMFESGVVKLISTDPHWRNLTAMDVMYETAPSPTILGYWAHQLPHAFHVGEIALTFLAELVAPLAAVFGGRRGRWFAFAAWSALQLGIQLTCNFGWLNTAALGLGVLLLDDTMLAAVLRRWRPAWANRFQAAVGDAAPSPRVALETRRGRRVPTKFPRYALRAALGLQCALTLYAFAVVCAGSPDALPAPLVAIAKPFGEFRSANGYSLYADFDFAHHQVDFEGSNDGGRTWRTYEYRHVPQRTDRVAAFLAPWYPRFEAAIQIESWTQGDLTMLPPVAAQLLRRSPPVLARFARDPFPDRPPTVVRMRRYRLAFTDAATLRRTGQYWRKEPDGDFQPAMYIGPQGEIAQFNLAEADAALEAKNFRAAFAIYRQQFQLGNLEAGYRLAAMYGRGLAGPEQPEKTFALFADLAARGELPARLNLALCYEYGVGTPVDYERAAAEYRRGVEMGSLAALYALGSLSASGHLAAAQDVEGLAALLRAGARTDGPDALLAQIRAEQPELVRKMTARMTASDVVRAQQRARELR